MLSRVCANLFCKSPTALCQTRYFTNNSFCNRKIVPLFRHRLTSFRTRGIRVHSVAVSVGLGRQFESSGCCVSKRSYGAVLTESKVTMLERKPFERLPTSVKPKHYALVLTPNLKTFVFEGEVSIQIEVGFKQNICRRAASGASDFLRTVI